MSNEDKEPKAEVQHYDLTNTPPDAPVPVDKDHPDAQPIPRGMGLPEAEAEQLAELKAAQDKADKEAADEAAKEAEADAKKAEADQKKADAPAAPKSDGGDKGAQNAG